MHPIVTPWLSFLGALVGALVLVRYARHASYEKTVGELYAKRRLDLVDRLAYPLHETIEILDQGEGAAATAFKSADFCEVLDEFRRALPLAEVFFGTGARAR